MPVATLGRLMDLLVFTGRLVCSVAPFYQPAEVAAAPRLSGAFLAGEQLWRFDARLARSLTVYTPRGARRFEATEFRVAGREGEASFIDVIALPGQGGELELEAPAPLHAVFLVEACAGGAELRPLDPGWALRNLTVGSPMLPGLPGGRVVLAGTTSELQVFLRWALYEPDAFGAPLRLRRIGREQS